MLQKHLIYGCNVQRVQGRVQGRGTVVMLSRWDEIPTNS